MPWEQLPEATMIKLGAQLTGCIGYLFPGFTLDAELQPELVAELMGCDDADGVPSIRLSSL